MDTPIWITLGLVVVNGLVSTIHLMKKNKVVLTCGTCCSYSRDPPKTEVDNEPISVKKNTEEL